MIEKKLTTAAQMDDSSDRFDVQEELMADWNRRVEERTDIDSPPIRRICFFNAVGILLALSSPLIVERHVVDFTMVRLARWPWTYSGVVSYSLALGLAGLAAFVTYLFMDRTQVGGRNTWVPPLCVGTPILLLSFFFPWGGWPHMGMWLWAAAFSALSHIFVVCRKARQHARGENLESLKATITTWQLIVVYGFTAYLAYVISALYIMWLASEQLVTSSKPDRIILFSSTTVQIAIFSVLIFMGPLREAWQMTFASVAQLAAYDTQTVVHAVPATNTLPDQ
jgi:hypothetical protein